ncbi:hypothetical protein [Floridanema evergladense]|uniref:Uncharacterized protein n=1 Tax=Floridaenema evergladense BLCC-F167 TaxID=3153639 RepID=A0ABV4WD30_9CYAN
MKVYTRTELESKSRSQLWEILDSLQLSHRRSKNDCIEAILGAMPQAVAQVEFNEYMEAQTSVSAWEVEAELRRELNERGYRDSMNGLPEQCDHISYRSGYARAWRDQVVLPEEKGATIEKASAETNDTDMLTPYTLAEWEAIPKFPGVRYEGNGTWKDSRNNRTNIYAKYYTLRQLAILDGKVPKFATKPIRQFVRF